MLPQMQKFSRQKKPSIELGLQQDYQYLGDTSEGLGHRRRRLNVALAIKHRTTHINRRRQRTRTHRAITALREGRFKVTRVIHQQSRTIARYRQRVRRSGRSIVIGQKTAT